MTEHGTKRYCMFHETTDAGDDRPAYAPDVPGCVAATATRGQTAQLIREALTLHLAAIRVDGDPLPQPSSQPWAAEMEIDIDAVLPRVLVTEEPPVTR